jgi:hypothetical protein
MGGAEEKTRTLNTMGRLGWKRGRLWDQGARSHRLACCILGGASQGFGFLLASSIHTTSPTPISTKK